MDLAPLTSNWELNFLVKKNEMKKMEDKSSMTMKINVESIIISLKLLGNI